jgi:hypothetical protein
MTHALQLLVILGVGLALAKYGLHKDKQEHNIPANNTSGHVDRRSGVERRQGAAMSRTVL